MAFGVYKRYKIATNLFVDWILSTSNYSQNIKRNNVNVRTVDNCVNQIVENESIPIGVERALKACEIAIDLREQMCSYYPTNETSNETHSYFISCLKRWNEALNKFTNKEVGGKFPVNFTPSSSSSSSSSSSQSIKQNKFSILYDDDDIFDENVSDSGSNYFEFTTIESVNEVTGGKISHEESKKLFDDELHFIICCMFYDLDTLFEQVSIAWMEVKQGKTTVIAATAVTITAIRYAEILDANFQLSFPSLKSVELLYNAFLADIGTDESMEQSKEAWSKNRYPNQFHRKSLFYTFRVFGSYLSSVGRCLQRDMYTIPKRGIFGPSFHEDRCLLKTESFDEACASEIAFIMYEIPKLKNFYFSIENFQSVLFKPPAATDSKIDDYFNQYKMMGAFMKPFGSFFETKEITVTTMFTLLCWLKSVYNLQGNKFISRTFSLTKFAIWNVSEMSTKAFSGESLQERGNNEMQFNSLYDLLFTWQSQQVLNHPEVFINNPIMSGCLLLDIVFQNLNISVNFMLSYSNHVRLTCELYHALKQEKHMLQTIPILETVINSCEQYLFGTSKPNKGFYSKNFLLRGNFKIETVRRIFGSNDFVSPRGGDHIQPPKYNDNPGSILYQILMHQNYNVIQNSNSTSSASSSTTKFNSYSQLLLKIKEIAVYEQIDPASRVLGMNFLTVNRVSYDFLNAFAQTVQSENTIEQKVFGVLVALDSNDLLDNMNNEARFGSQWSQKAAATNLDSSATRYAISLNKLFSKYFQPIVEPIRMKQERLHLATDYGTTGVIFTDQFYYLPNYINAHTMEFGNKRLWTATKGSKDINEKDDEDLTTSTFCKWMDVFEDYGQPLTDDMKIDYCDMLKSYPYCLYKYDPASKLSTHLHHFAGGVVKDKRIFELLVQLAADDLVSGDIV